MKRDVRSVAGQADRDALARRPPAPGLGAGARRGAVPGGTGEDKNAGHSVLFMEIAPANAASCSEPMFGRSHCLAQSARSL